MKSVMQSQLFILFVLLFASQSSFCVEGYSQPPKEILEIMQAPASPTPIMSPTLDRILLVSMQDYPSIERVAEPFLRLAGVRIEPRNHSNHDTPGGYGIPACARSFSIVKVKDGVEQKIDISKMSCADAPRWSADGQHFFTKNRAQNAVELWIGDIQTGKVSKLKNIKLNPMFGNDVQWMPDQQHLLVKLVPQNLGPAPQTAEVLTGPSIQESSGKKGQSSTYEKRDTLNNKNDERLFEYYGKSQLAIVDLKGKITPFAEVALYEKLLVAPDGIHILSSKIVPPYSYIVTYFRFPKKVEVMDISKLQNPLSQTIAELPLADRVPIHGEPLGPRDFSWSPHDPATLIWAEALDGGDWNVNVPERDKVMVLKAPFRGQAQEIFRTVQRYEGMSWFEKRDSSILYEYDENKHWLKSYIVNFDHPQQEKKLLWDLSSDEEYANPGQPVRTTLKNGYAVVKMFQNSIYLNGKGASLEGDRPFLDKLDLTNLKTERLFRSSKTEYEWFFSLLAGDDTSFLTWHQTQEIPPNVFKLTFSDKINSTSTTAPSTAEASYQFKRTQLTHLPDPTPQIRGIKKRLVKYKRADGLDLSFTLYTPPGYQEGTRVPTILYAYPLDYADASKAGQITGSQNTFTRLRDYRLLLMAGYAIIDRAAFPIVGDPKKAYDNYLEQLVADAKAAVDEAVRLGVADPQHIGVTGHSHGALMTVNLLAHSNFFKAGVATSGSYNKTLTPFGFQSERRTAWEAPEVYKKVSPFFVADKLKTPLLIIHGADDANPGTTPMQASFLYDAVRANGGTTRLVMLPHEPHWYTARESNEQEIYEMLRWFDQYVKGTFEKK